MTESEKLQYAANAKALMEEIFTSRKHSIVQMMRPQLVRCEPEALSVTFAFPGMEWECNPTGAVHGGIVCAMFDTAMGLTLYPLIGVLTPTISLNTSFLRPAPGNGTILVRAAITKRGQSVLYISAEMWEESAPDKIVGTAQGVFHVPAAASDRTQCADSCRLYES